MYGHMNVKKSCWILATITNQSLLFMEIIAVYYDKQNTQIKNA